MGILEDAVAGRITAEMKIVAEEEEKTPEFICRGIASGHIVIPLSPYRDTKPVGIGKGLRTKVNASIGTSSDIVDVEMEVKKARVAEANGADTLMELSTEGDFREIRRRVVEAATLSVGSVPLYQAFIEAIRKYGAGVEMPEDDLFRVTEEQARLGTNFMAIHTGINSICVERLKRQGGRFGGVCSRGGAFMIGWMLHNQKENPLYREFDYLLEILKEHEVTLSLGNGLRAGAVHDSTDRAQIQELIINAELADRAQAAGVQTIVEGPGHIPIDEIEANVKVMKRMTNERPFYMLGPLVTDIAPGHDHIVAAIGASLSSAYGADFICYVTPAEHLALPNVEDVRQGVITARIAAHIGDMVKNGARDQDLEMGRARRDMLWEKQFEMALDPETARQVRSERAPSNSMVCTMCGDYCALKIIKENIDLRR
ncbi:MAG: phosphomethylpyrimidine synthase ThiC [Methanothrix soehngenii]|jgi:phosphomethylpyrimidine synthase|uniref:phosphomethylpyrimidine synthase ThiC n=1 Tax=Methanothrix soehngenii TaxID=2223 RepID=UPI0023F14A15|nr:phosphomethylpyrimidine synthase ThiC [Methanothrix soehngenii]MDD5256507.1 phosphomethylpyrimidine synthase ThiC [Methanothrix soehngenii]